MAAWLRSFRFQATTEKEFQDAIEQALARKWSFRREVNLSAGDRIDFLVEGGVGIEVKIQGTAARTWRQLERYAKSAEVTSLILMTTRSQVVAGFPESIDGKLVVPVVWRRGLL